MSHFQAGQKLTAEQLNVVAHQGIQLLDETVLTATAGTVTFSGINQQAQTLWLLRSGNVTGGTNPSVFVRFNGDTGSTYLELIAAHVGDGSTVSLYDATKTNIFIGSGATAASMSTVLIPNYSRTDREKPVQVEYSKLSSTAAADVEVGKVFGRWDSIAAITQIDIVAAGGGAHDVGSIFTLYGLGASV